MENRLKGYNRVTITTSKYHPQSKPPAYTPLAPSDTANAVPAPSRRELWGAYLSTWVCTFKKCLLWNPSVTPPACQLPLAREPFCARYRSMVRYRAFLDLQSTAWERNAPKKPQLKTGAGGKTQHPSQSEGSTSRWFLPGDSQGGNNSSGSELFPP